MVVRNRDSSAQAIRRTSPENIVAFPSCRSRTELYAKGEELRTKCPRSSHAAWKPSKNRIDPLTLITESDKRRLPKLVPIRHGRMMKSPFTFYRGAALTCPRSLT
jgi:hypothetical protein